jgi:DNA-binding PadR family transcriptional regulator
LRYALLGVLEARPMTGYELAQFFDESANWVWSAPHSNIYPALRRLQSEGLLSGHTDIKGAKLERTVYSITDDGRRELRDWVVSDPGSPLLRDPIMLRMVFADLIEPPDEIIKLLSVLIERQSDLIAQWKQHADALRRKQTPLILERLKNRPSAVHDRIAEIKANVFDLMITQAEVWIEWATATIELLDGDTTRP